MKGPARHMFSSSSHKVLDHTSLPHKACQKFRCGRLHLPHTTRCQALIERVRNTRVSDLKKIRAAEPLTRSEQIELTLLTRKCNTWRHVEQLFRKECRNMNHINLVALVSRLQQVLPPPRVVPQVSLRTLHADAREARDLGRGEASLRGSSDAADSNSSVDDTIEAEASYTHDAPGPDVDSLPDVPPYELEDLLQLYDELVLQICSAMPDMSISELAPLSWAAAKIGMHHAWLWMDIEEYSYSLLLPDFESFAASSGYDVSEARSILSKLPWALPLISSYATATAKRHPVPQPLGTFEEFLRPPPPPEPLEKNVPTAKELSTLIFAYSLSPHRPSPQWVKGYCRATIGLLPEAENQALANMLFALVRCGVVPDYEWTECWLGVVGPRLAEFRVEELTQMMWAFSECAAAHRRSQQRMYDTTNTASHPSQTQTSNTGYTSLDSSDAGVGSGDIINSKGCSSSSGSSSSTEKSSNTGAVGCNAPEQESFPVSSTSDNDPDNTTQYSEMWGSLDPVQQTDADELEFEFEFVDEDDNIIDVEPDDSLEHLDLDPVEDFRSSALSLITNALASNLQHQYKAIPGDNLILEPVDGTDSEPTADISLPSDAWIQAMCDSLEGRLGELQPQNHAIILTGCMSLDFVPQPDWITSCLRHATTPPLPPAPRILDMRPRNLLAILSAVAAWQHVPEEDVAERFITLVRQLQPVMTDEDLKKLEGMLPALQKVMPAMTVEKLL